MLRQPSFERRGRVLADVSFPVRRCGRARLCVWPCNPLVAARGLQLQSPCTAIYGSSSDITFAAVSIVCGCSVMPTATVLLAARGLQYAMQNSTVGISMYVCVISNLRNVFVFVFLPSLGFCMVTNVSA